MSQQAASRTASPFATHGFQMAPWQEEAAVSWVSGNGGPFRGTLEIFTGGGKTLIALKCIERAAQKFDDLKVAVVVPTEALARQWREVIISRTHLDPPDVGILGAGRKDTFEGRRALICVLNTASKVLPDMAEGAQPLMLVVDECHRAGAPTFSKVLSTRAVAKLGLSATPEREEVDEDGEPIVFDEQLVGQKLGPVVTRFSLKEARQVGWLPTYTIFHHGIDLAEDELTTYEAISRRVDDAAEKMRELGIETSRARAFANRKDDVGRLAQAWVSATSSRKDLLYKASERERIAAKLIREALARPESPRILLFHERVGEAVILFEHLRKQCPDVRIALEHSRLAPRARLSAIEAFRVGAAPVLVSVKSLVEGLDVPEADVGISVASSSSVRQRIQSLGRVLRRQFDKSPAPKHSEMHLLYVAETVDDLIYTKEDWSDLTGESSNVYLRWELGSEEPLRKDAPPHEPLPTEDQEWERLGQSIPESPVPWKGALPNLEYSVDTLGNVTNALGSVIANPQGVDEMVTAVRGRPGGRFRVTPLHRLVVVFGEGDHGTAPFLAGKLSEPFVIASIGDESGRIPGDEEVKPGHPYPGPPDKAHGTFRLRQKRGGVIERSAGKRAMEFALADNPNDGRDRNAKAVLEAWKEVSSKGFTFHVNSLWHAWYLEGGQRRFLAHVPGGFKWPSERREHDAVSG